jgi:hypothetical protein
MSKSILKTTLVGLASIFLFVACFQIMPISISLGQDDKKMNGKKTFDLQPGELYLVYSDTSFTLPEGVYVGRYGLSASLHHDGMYKNKQEHCGGLIMMQLQDDGCITYECRACHQKWKRNAEGKIVESSEKK